MTPRVRRLAIVAGGVAALGVATALVLSAFRSNLVFFYTPSQVIAREAPAARAFRIGGLVEQGSVRRDGLVVHFLVTDSVRAVPVRYEGILPDLFREGRGVVAQGRLDGEGIFLAREVFAKHDETYTPREAADAVRRARAAAAAEPGGAP